MHMAEWDRFTYEHRLQRLKETEELRTWRGDRSMNKLQNLRKNIHLTKWSHLRSDIGNKLLNGSKVWRDGMDEAIQHRGACSDIGGIFLGFCLA